MLSYDLDRRGSASLYEFLYRCVRDDIVAGALLPDDRLPSKRDLAHHLGVGVVTVENAYAQLVAEGYVRSEARRGFYVNRLPQESSRQVQGTARLVRHSGEKGPMHPAASAGAPESLQTLDTLPPHVRWESFTESGETRDLLACSSSLPDAAPSPFGSDGGEKSTAYNPGAHPRSHASPAPPRFDLTGARAGTNEPAARLWSRALRSALAEEPHGELFSASPAAGLPRLRRAIAAHLAGSRGMEVDPSQIVVGAGAQLLYMLVAQLLGPGASVAVEDPGYPRLVQTYRSMGVRVLPVPLDVQGMRADALHAAGATAAHVMPSHQFPTGRVMSAARRYELLGWAAEKPGRVIVEDDYDWEFRLAGRPVPPLAGIDALGTVVYISTFSKSLSSALRMAYLVLPAGLCERFEGRLGHLAGTVSAIDQVTLARLLESGDYERHVRRYRTRCRSVRDALIERLASCEVADRLGIEEADSGLHFVLAVRTGEGASAPVEAERAICATCEQLGVCVMPLSAYAIDAASLPRDGWARLVIQYDGLDQDDVPHVAELLAGGIGETGTDVAG